MPLCLSQIPPDCDGIELGPRWWEAIGFIMLAGSWCDWLSWMKVTSHFRLILNEFINQDVRSDEDGDFGIKNKDTREEQKVSVYLFYYKQCMVGFDWSNHFCTTNCWNRNFFFGSPDMPLRWSVNAHFTLLTKEKVPHLSSFRGHCLNVLMNLICVPRKEFYLWPANREERLRKWAHFDYYCENKM